MNRLISRHCPGCRKYQTVSFTNEVILMCPHCQEHWAEIQDKDEIFSRCLMCGCRQFYLAKDFNQLLGCFVVLIGIILVPFTWGLSLATFALLDWLLYRKVKNVIVCYKCGCEFRNFQTTVRFKSFMHHIGLKYDKYR